MAGTKGHSGRKAYLEQKTVREICRLSAATLFHALRCDDPKIMPLDKKAELAKHFVLRVMPQKIESDGSLAPKTVIIIRAEDAKDLNANRLEANPVTL